MSDLTAEKARSLWDYDPETGSLVWRIGRGNRSKGSAAGSPNACGYVQIQTGGKLYRKNRLVWLIVTGSWPTGEVDHINGVKDDDRWANLRECSRAQNMWNKGVHRSNKLGIKGVYKAGNSYIAQIKQSGVCMYLGSFKTVEEAEAARVTAAAKYHGKFART